MHLHSFEISKFDSSSSLNRNLVEKFSVKYELYKYRVPLDISNIMMHFYKADRIQEIKQQVQMSEINKSSGTSFAVMLMLWQHI